jgi:hypothetical protein
MLGNSIVYHTMPKIREVRLMTDLRSVRSRKLSNGWVTKNFFFSNSSVLRNAIKSLACYIYSRQRSLIRTGSMGYA